MQEKKAAAKLGKYSISFSDIESNFQNKYFQNVCL